MLHCGCPLFGSGRIDVKDRKTLAFAYTNAQQAYPSLGVVYLLQFNLLAAQGDFDFCNFAYLCRDEFPAYGQFALVPRVFGRELANKLSLSLICMILKYYRGKVMYYP